MFNDDYVSLVHHGGKLYTMITFPSFYNFVFPVLFSSYNSVVFCFLGTSD